MLVDVSIRSELSLLSCCGLVWRVSTDHDITAARISLKNNLSLFDDIWQIAQFPQIRFSLSRYNKLKVL